MSRYQPLPRWRWRLPSRRATRRFAVATAALGTVATVLVVGYYGYQNWRSKHTWRSFLTSLKQSGESLNLSPLLPGPVPDVANFARSPAFLGLFSRTNTEATALFKRMRPFDLQPSIPQGTSVLMDWSHQRQVPLQPFVNWTNLQPGNDPATKRQAHAAAVLQGLQSQSGTLRELAAAAARLPAFQTATNRDAGVVLQPVREPVLLLERLHLLFQVRACASIALGQTADAAEDLLTGLRLARLARQLTDTRSTVRVQVLLARSLQPLWEGLGQHAWTEPQLATFQRELDGFNLLADYTNAVRRVVLAHIEVWRAIPDNTNSYGALPEMDTRFLGDPTWQLQPRAWWFDNCIQLHQAARNVLEQVDVAGGRIQPALYWSDLNGLPLDPPTSELLQQSLWWGPSPSVVAFAQTAVNQATTACALERFRLANRVYPQALGELVPALLDRVPHDAVSGRPLIYQSFADGTFLLRGVGPNGTDDRANKPSDDWLWTYSTNTPSAR